MLQRLQHSPVSMKTPLLSIVSRLVQIPQHQQELLKSGIVPILLSIYRGGDADAADTATKALECLSHPASEILARTKSGKAFLAAQKFASLADSSEGSSPSDSPMHAGRQPSASLLGPSAQATSSSGGSEAATAASKLPIASNAASAAADYSAAASGSVTASPRPNSNSSRSSFASPAPGTSSPRRRPADGPPDAASKQVPSRSGMSASSSLQVQELSGQTAMAAASNDRSNAGVDASVSAMQDQGTAAPPSATDRSESGSTAVAASSPNRSSKQGLDGMQTSSDLDGNRPLPHSVAWVVGYAGVKPGSEYIKARGDHTANGPVAAATAADGRASPSQSSKGSSAQPSQHVAANEAAPHERQAAAAAADSSASPAAVYAGTRPSRSSTGQIGALHRPGSAGQAAGSSQDISDGCDAASQQQAPGTPRSSQQQSKQGAGAAVPASRLPKPQSGMSRQPSAESKLPMPRRSSRNMGALAEELGQSNEGAGQTSAARPQKSVSKSNVMGAASLMRALSGKDRDSNASGDGAVRGGSPLGSPRPSASGISVHELVQEAESAASTKQQPAMQNEHAGVAPAGQVEALRESSSGTEGKGTTADVAPSRDKQGAEASASPAAAAAVAKDQAATAGRPSSAPAVAVAEPLSSVNAAGQAAGSSAAAPAAGGTVSPNKLVRDRQESHRSASPSKTIGECSIRRPVHIMQLRSCSTVVALHGGCQLICKPALFISFLFVTISLNVAAILFVDAKGASSRPSSARAGPGAASYGSNPPASQGTPTAAANAQGPTGTRLGRLGQKAPPPEAKGEAVHEPDRRPSPLPARAAAAAAAAAASPQPSPRPNAAAKPPAPAAPAGK